MIPIFADTEEQLALESVMDEKEEGGIMMDELPMMLPLS